MSNFLEIPPYSVTSLHDVATNPIQTVGTIFTPTTGNSAILKQSPGVSLIGGATRVLTPSPSHRSFLDHSEGTIDPVSTPPPITFSAPNLVNFSANNFVSAVPLTPTQQARMATAGNCLPSDFPRDDSHSSPMYNRICRERSKCNR